VENAGDELTVVFSTVPELQTPTAGFLSVSIVAGVTVAVWPGFRALAVLFVVGPMPSVRSAVERGLCGNARNPICNPVTGYDISIREREATNALSNPIHPKSVKHSSVRVRHSPIPFRQPELSINLPTIHPKPCKAFHRDLQVFHKGQVWALNGFKAATIDNLLFPYLLPCLVP
jgi:hypothetical protein